MNIRELILPIAFAFVATFALQYLFFGNKEHVAVETTFIAPQEKREYKPLNLEVDFLDQKQVLPHVTDIETEWGFLQFSTAAASLESLDIKREINGAVRTIRTIFPVTQTEKENHCFLVGLDEKTPFNYGLTSMTQNDNIYQLAYQGENDNWVIQKTFIISKNVPQIDLMLELSLKSNKNIVETPRLFYPAPLMVDIRDNDTISSLVIDQSDIFAKKRVDQLNTQSGWFRPTLFGADDRYFIHAMIHDENSFASRAYYKLENRDRLFSILEGPSVNDSAFWKLSFYFGPKDMHLMSAVDNRLEQSLDFSGWLSGLAKVILYILNWLYKYLHNYGLAIIVLTLLIQILLLPFTLRNNEEKLKKQQKEYQKKLALIEMRFKDSPEKLALEKAEFIKREGLPGGLGCLIPLLLQLPLFFALSRVLSSSFELYQAPMLWIKDLSSKDPYYILPIIIVIVMSLQESKGAVNAQQRFGKIMMAVVFGAVSASFSAGLALYFACSRIFNVIQTMLMRYFKLV